MDRVGDLAQLRLSPGLVRDFLPRARPGLVRPVSAGGGLVVLQFWLRRLGLSLASRLGRRRRLGLLPVGAGDLIVPRSAYSALVAGRTSTFDAWV